jgi:hypothetical protein
MDNRIIYLGKDEAIKANAMVGFTASDLIAVQNALESAGLDYLAHKVEYAREWATPLVGAARLDAQP